MLFNRINNRALIHKGIFIPVLISIFLLISGCGTLSPSSNKANDKKNMETELTIYSSFQDQFFYKYYGNYLIQEYPNIKFRLIQSTSENAEEMAKEVQQSKPDLIITWKDNFRELQRQNMLTDLNNFVQSRDFNLEDYYPEMITTLQNDTGQLNGLSPMVSPFVVFYNKNLFDENKIGYPTNQISWDEMLSLTQQFIGSGTTGLTGRSPASLLSAIAKSKGWKIVDTHSKNLIFNAQEWTSSIQKILDSSRGGNLVNDTGELFLQGKAAMHYGTLDMIPKLLEKNSFAWEVVTTPVDSLNRDISSDIYFYDIFCIPEEASQKEAAWEVIQALLSGESVTYLQNNSIPGSVSTLSKYMNSQYGNVDLSAIWKQKIDNKPYLSSELSRNFIDKFDGVVDTVLTRAVSNKNISPEECFTEIEEQAKVLYQEERQAKSE
ncbi:ABC transporter substrate-binding protein [Paenibacillus sanfengchensis]|uniref:ABC transporter substrate-binding protein n=1 Tax=Paenibacillus sanfengchensis TaxID=3119819 RepID=UPI002FE35459